MKRRIIVVLGMHRSGTSAVTRGLQALGIELGDNLLEAVPGNNDKGFWEDVDILDINMRLLEHLGSNWDALPLISPDAINLERLQNFISEASNVLEKKFENASVFGVKDPRICILLPFWKHIFQSLELDTRYVLSLRHPLAVAGSLRRRDQISMQRSLTLWNGYTERALSFTSNEKRIFVDYDDVLDNPERELEKIAALAGIAMETVDANAIQEYTTGFLTKDLNHSFETGCKEIEEDLLQKSECIYFDLYTRCQNNGAQKRPESREKLLLNSQLFALDHESQKKDGLLFQLQQKIDAEIEKSHAHLNRVGELELQLNELNRKSTTLKQQLDTANDALRSARADNKAILSSTSWRVSAPLRLAKHIKDGNRKDAAKMILPLAKPLARQFLAQVPLRFRAKALGWMHAIASKLFPGMGAILRYQYGNTQRYGGDLTHLEDLPIPLSPIQAKIAIHIHLFYDEMAPYFASTLNKIPCNFDVFISTREDADKNAIRQAFSACHKAQHVEVIETANIGRDIYPFVCLFGPKLMQYDVLCHLHSKKSLYNNGATQGWLEYIVDMLFRSANDIARILKKLSDDSSTGIIYPQNFHGVPYMANTWLANRSTAEKYRHRFGLASLPSGYFDYPVGSMFWAKKEALQALFNAGITRDDFEAESGQTDGTLAHCIERLYVLVANQAGYDHVILADKYFPGWSRWRWEQFFGRTAARTADFLVSQQTELVIFDVFDTLLIRPLVDPDATKCLVAERFDADTRSRYMNYRHLAEQQARETLGRDVNIDDIYQCLMALAPLTAASMQQLLAMEEAIESASVSPRPDAVSLLRAVVASGKRVILASDMFLKQDTIEKMLEKFGITGWSKLYVSNVYGMRKDDGNLYEHIALSEGVPAEKILMVGDNERSDFQIPCDMGMQTLHLLRPVDIARASSRFSPLLRAHDTSEFDINREILLGSLIRYNFGGLFFDHFSPEDFCSPNPEAIGYSVLGPIVTCFVQWLLDEAQEHCVEKLYFLAREGEFIKEMYDLWQDHVGNGPESTYLVLSRRAVTVPAIKTMDDILSIAGQNYFSNSLDNFLLERFGIVLDETARNEIYSKGLWKAGKQLEILDKNVSMISSLLVYLEQRIYQQARIEESGLLEYLHQTGLIATENPFVVDVGYAGSIQSALCNVTRKKIHGFYMLTNQRAEATRDQANVTVDACFGNFLANDSAEPLLYSRSFELEKLLSSNQAQVVRYTSHENGSLSPDFRTLSLQETLSAPLREKIRKGARAFIKDQMLIERDLLPGYRIPVDTTLQIYSLFVSQMSERENQIMKALALDDFYCGRGVVS